MPSAEWDDQDPSPPWKAGAAELLPDGLSTRAEQLLALFSYQNPSGKSWKLVPLKCSNWHPGCHLLLAEPCFLHPDFALSLVKSGAAFPVPDEPWIWQKGLMWSTLNAPTISIHDFLFPHVRPQIYSLLLLKTCCTTHFEPAASEARSPSAISYTKHPSLLMGPSKHALCKYICVYTSAQPHKYLPKLEKSNLLPSRDKLTAKFQSIAFSVGPAVCL